MKKDFYDNLRSKTERIVQEGLRLASDETYLKDESNHYQCASCLAAIARGNVDEKDYDGWFHSSEDICMLKARNILADKLGWKIR